MSFDEIDFLKKLVSIYSPTFQEKRAVDFCVKQMTELGFNAFSDAVGNAVGTLGDGPNEVILLGHIDTVPGFIEVRQEGDSLWGRGSVDAKGSLANFISAVARTGAKPGMKWIVIGAVGEESNSRGAWHLINQYHPKMTIIGEPSGWDRITLGYKGNLWVKYQIKEPAMHSANLQKNANEMAIDFWNDVIAYAGQANENKERNFEKIIPSLRDMKSIDDGFNQTATIQINLRLPSSIQPDEIMHTLQNHSNKGVLEFNDPVSAYQADKNNGLVRAFLRAIREQQGKPGFLLKTGTSDMNIVGPVWNCPILAYGPGDSNFDHTPDEHIQLSEYQMSTRILAQALQILAIENGN